MGKTISADRTEKDLNLVIFATAQRLGALAAARSFG